MTLTHYFSILFILLCLFVQNIQAQQNDSTKWHQGRIKLASGQYIHGSLRFSHEVLLQNNDLIWAQGLRYQKKKLFKLLYH